MQVGQVEKTIHEFLNTMDESIRDSAKVSKFFSTLDEAGLKMMEEASKQSMQELLFVLLNFVSVGSETAALAACDRILLFLKNIPVMFDSFNPNRDVLKKLNLKRLLGAKQSQIVYDLMIFILRYYSDVDYDDYDLGTKFQETLVKEEKKRVWLILDHILIKQNTFLEDFRTRNATTAKALGEILSYISDLKKSINESKSQNRSSMNHGDHAANQSALSAEELGKLAEKKEVELLKREVENLKESLMKSAIEGKGKSPAPAKKDEKGVDKGLTDPPKAYLMDGVTNELTNLKSRFNSLLLEMEDLKKVTSKLTDEKNTKLVQLERKVEDDLESFRLFKERVQIEVGTLKDRAGGLRNSSVIPGNSSMMERDHVTPGRGSHPHDDDAHAKLETLTKIQENFKRETILNLNKLNTAMTILGKKLGLSGLNMNSPNFDPNDIKDEEPKMTPAESQKNSGVGLAAAANKLAKASDNLKKEKEKQFSLMDDDKVNKIESRIYEQELLVKKLIFDHKKELLERIDILTNTMDDFRNRQSSSTTGGKQDKKEGGGGKSSDQTYEDFMEKDRKKEIDEYLKQLRKETENRFANDEKDILYLSEKFKYLESDIRALKIERESRDKISKNILEKGVNLDEDFVRKEFLGMRADHESIAEKMQVLSDEVVGVRVQVEEMQKTEFMNKEIGGGGDGRSPFSEDMKQHITQVQKEMTKLREDLVKRENDLGRKLESTIMASISKKGGVETMEDPKKIRELIRSETEHIFEFIQEYVNEIAMNQIGIVKSTKRGSTEKMDALDWMVRNIEFISPSIFNSFKKTCHEIYEKNNPEKTMMYLSAHSSDVLLSVRKLILDAIEPNTNEMVKGYLPNYLEALEIGLLNEYNQERGVEIGIHDIMITVITGEVDEGVSLRAEKCMSILLAKDTLIQKCIGKTVFVKWLANCLRKKSSDIILAESRLNILAMAFKSTPVTENILKHNNNLANEVVKQLRSSKASNAVLEANVQAFYNFSTCSTLLDYVTPPEVLETVIEIANEVPINKLKQTLYKGLNNFVKKQKFLELIQKSGMLEVIRNTTI